MPMSKERREQINKWDSENMAYQTIKVRKSLLDAFKAACAERGDKVNTVLREAMERYVGGSVGDDVQNVVVSLDDVIAVCAVLDALVLGDTREDVFIKQIRDKLDQLRDVAIEKARENSEVIQ